MTYSPASTSRSPTISSTGSTRSSPPEPMSALSTRPTCPPLSSARTFAAAPSMSGPASDHSLLHSRRAPWDDNLGTGVAPKSPNHRTSVIHTPRKCLDRREYRTPAPKDDIRRASSSAYRRIGYHVESKGTWRTLPGAVRAAEISTIPGRKKPPDEWRKLTWRSDVQYPTPPSPSHSADSGDSVSIMHGRCQWICWTELPLINRVRSPSSTKAGGEWIGRLFCSVLVGEMRLHRGMVDRCGFGVR